MYVPSPFLLPSPPLLFLNVILRFTPLSLVCPWTLVPSWERLPFFLPLFSLSLPLSFSLCFLSSPSFFLGCPWVLSSQLGALPFWCVLGRLCRSWEHLCVPLSLLLFSSSPSTPLSSRAACLQANKAFATGFSMRFGLSSVCSLSFGSPFIGPHRRLPFFSFMSFCLHVSSSSSFPSLARTIVRTLVCTHRRARILLTFLGRMGVPPFRAGWRPHMPRGVCVCV